APFADAMLPAAAAHEKDGHVTDWEGRAQPVRTLRGPAGLARPDWQIFQELSEALGQDMGFHSLEGLQEEMHQLLQPSSGRAEVGSDSAERFPRSALASLSPDVPLRRTAPHAAGTLMLFSYPLLVDEGVLSEGADELKKALEDEAFIEVNAGDADRIGLADG